MQNLVFQLRAPRLPAAGRTVAVCGLSGPQLRARQPAYGNRTARSRQPGSPQLENEVLHQAFLYYTCAKTTKPTGNSHIKTQRLGCSAPENRGF